MRIFAISNLKIPKNKNEKFMAKVIILKKKKIKIILKKKKIKIIFHLIMKYLTYQVKELMLLLKWLLVN